MEIFEKLGLFFGKMAFREKLSQTVRQVQLQDLSTARSVALIFNATLRADLEKAQAFMAFLQSKGIETEGIGFVRDEGSTQYYSPEKNLCYLTRKEINWMGLPFGPNVEDFLRPDFDMLINLYGNDLLAVRYLVGLSKAKYKVGPLWEEPELYDFMLEMGPDADTGDFIAQLKKYLEMIRPSGV